MYTSISEFIIRYVVGIRLLYLAPVRNIYIKKSNNWLHPLITIQLLTPEHIILEGITSHNLKDLKITSQICPRSALQLVFTKDMDRAIQCF